MNVISYPPILDGISLNELRKEVEYFLSDYKFNRWVGIHDEPENTIEKYIQDSFDLYLRDSCHAWFESTPWNQIGEPVGFEWWIESLFEHNTITMHSNHDDEYRKNNYGIIKYPLVSTETHLTNDIDPTTILNTKQGNYWEVYENNPPTEAVFSAPEEGKFVVSDPRYMRGVFGRRSHRLSLCYDVWHYKPQHLDRIGMVCKPFECRFYKRQSTLPTQWLGKTRMLKLNLGDKTITNKFPTTYNEGETWKVTQ